MHQVANFGEKTSRSQTLEKNAPRSQILTQKIQNLRSKISKPSKFIQISHPKSPNLQISHPKSLQTKKTHVEEEVEVRSRREPLRPRRRARQEHNRGISLWAELTEN
jgi:hypothetical protein